MFRMLISCTQVATLHKITAHTNIDGNEQAHALAIYGCELNHKDVATPYEHAHPTLLPTRLVALHARDTQQKPHKAPLKIDPQT